MGFAGSCVSFDGFGLVLGWGFLFGWFGFDFFLNVPFLLLSAFVCCFPLSVIEVCKFFWFAIPSHF